MFLDRDGDGLRGPDEPGRAGVLIEVVDGTGAVVGTATTGADGGYAVGGLAPGAYTVREVQPPGSGSTTPDEVPVTVTAGAGATADFGDRLGSVSGVVFSDDDRDGVRDPAEPLLGGIPVRLLDAGGGVVATTATDDRGAYVFPDLPAGDYRVEVDLPEGRTPTVRDAGDDDSADSDLDPATATTGPLVVAVGSDGAITQVGSVDAGLLPADVPTTTPPTTTTDPTTTEPTTEPPTTTVPPTTTEPPATTEPTMTEPTTVPPTTTEPPATTEPTTVPPTTEPTTTAPTTTAPPTTTVPPGPEPGAIGGVVFRDLDGDGVRDPGEPALAGVPVRIVDAEGRVVAEVVTGADGRYLVSGLAPGRYTVQVPGEAGGAGPVDRPAVVESGETAEVDVPRGVVVPTTPPTTPSTTPPTPTPTTEPPTTEPTEDPTTEPTDGPTTEPTDGPTDGPTAGPTDGPSTPATPTSPSPTPSGPGADPGEPGDDPADRPGGPGGGGPGGDLAYTGAPLVEITVLGVVALLAGLLLLVVTRRRRATGPDEPQDGA